MSHGLIFLVAFVVLLFLGLALCRAAQAATLDRADSARRWHCFTEAEWARFTPEETECMVQEWSEGRRAQDEERIPRP